MNRDKKYAQVDFEQLAIMAPVNRLAALVTTQPKTITEFEDVRDDYDNYKAALARYREILALMPKDDERRSEIVIVVNQIDSLRIELKNRFPYLGRKRRGAFQSYLLDEVKPLLSKEQWRGCVERAERAMFENYKSQ